MLGGEPHFLQLAEPGQAKRPIGDAARIAGFGAKID